MTRSIAEPTGSRRIVRALRVGISTALLAGVVSTFPAAATTAADLGPTLAAGATMRAGQYLRSPGGTFTLVLQGDGNLVEYNAAHVALWDPPPPSATFGQSGDRLVMQTDGNPVVYSSTNAVLWAAYTQNHPGSRLVLQDDGNLVVYSAAGSPLWATMTGRSAPLGATRGANLFPGGQCTWFAEQMSDRYTGQFPNFWGNAAQWPASAAGAGWQVGATPRIGSVIVFAAYHYGTGGYGHVGWVRQFYPSTNTVVFDEMNWVGPGIVDTRSITYGVNNPYIRYIYMNP
jgi:surface antigen